MKYSKILLTTILASSFVYANTDISITSGKKDYSNSKKKIDGTTLNLSASHKYENGKITLGYLKDEVNLITNPNGDLEVTKYNANYTHSLNQKLDLKVSYISIVDNQAPTDEGKVYGFGATYKIAKGLGAKFDMYKSDYNPFDVNQYDLSLFKGFKINKIKGKLTVGTKFIKIDGDTYNPDAPAPKQYDFYEKDYNTNFVKIGLNYNGYTAGLGAFFGKRMFTVLDNGAKVQHHAMEQDKTYMLSVGKKFKNFDVVAKYSFQNGNELPEKQTDVDTKVTSLMLKYKF